MEKTSHMTVNSGIEKDIHEVEGQGVRACYIIAKKFEGHGCLALKTEYSRETALLVDYLSQKKRGEGIQILTISSKEAYGEYEPYTDAESREDFISQVLAMI